MNCRYSASGSLYERHYGSVYRISSASISKIIMETCTAIYEELAKTEFETYSQEYWLNVSNSFFNKWNFPNCLGAIDGKHIKIKKPANAGSSYYNNKVIFNINSETETGD